MAELPTYYPKTKISPTPFFTPITPGHHILVESKRERMKQLNCLSIQEKENTRLIYREKTILGEAEYHNRVRRRLPVPKLVLLLSMGAGVAHGGYKPPS